MCSQAVVYAQCLPEENSTTMLHAFYGDASHIATRLVASTYLEVSCCVYCNCIQFELSSPFWSLLRLDTTVWHSLLN